MEIVEVCRGDDVGQLGGIVRDGVPEVVIILV